MLTPKRRRFIAAFLGSAVGNQTEAAAQAGYAGDRRQLAVQAHQIMQDPEVQRMINEGLEELLERSVQRFSDAMNATKRKVFITKQGDIVYSEPEVDHNIRLGAADRFLKAYDRLAGRRPSRISNEVAQPDEISPEPNNQVPAIDATDRAFIREAVECELKADALDGDQSEGGGE